VKLVVPLVATIALVAGARPSPAGNDVRAEATRAIAHTFYTVAEIAPAKAGLFAPTTSTGYLDPVRGRGHWHVTSEGKAVSETAVDGAHMKRYDPTSNTLTVASSCRAFASGCAEVLDPIDLYRRTLTSASGPAQQAGGDWQLTLHGVADVEQVVTVDGQTYLPKRIEWREQGVPVSVVRITTLVQEDPGDDAFRLDAHPMARVRLLTARGTPVRVLSKRATTVPRGAYWLGPSYGGIPARATDVRTNAGRSLRIAYGLLVVWNYEDYLPPEIVAATTGFAKTFPLPQGGVARSYFNARGIVVVDVEIGGRRVALVSPNGKIDSFAAARALRKRT
jgi:hypothetical protein